MDYDRTIVNTREGTGKKGKASRTMGQVLTYLIPLKPSTIAPQSRIRDLQHMGEKTQDWCC